MSVSTQLAYTIRQIVSMVDKGELVKPRIQRKTIWSVEKSAKYIEHLLKFECSPQQLLINKTTVNGRDVLQLVDGGNRVAAMFCFYKKPFSLFDSKFQEMLDNLPIICNRLRKKYYHVYKLFTHPRNEMDIQVYTSRSNYMDVLDDYIYNMSNTSKTSVITPEIQNKIDYLEVVQRQIEDILKTLTPDEKHALDMLINNTILRALKTEKEGNQYENIQININQYNGLGQTDMVQLFNDVNIPATVLSPMDSLNAILCNNNVSRPKLVEILKLVYDKAQTNIDINLFVNLVNHHYGKKIGKNKGYKGIKEDVAYDDSDNVYAQIEWQIAEIDHSKFEDMSIFEVLIGITKHFSTRFDSNNNAHTNDTYNFIKMETDITDAMAKIPFTFRIYDHVYNSGRNYKNKNMKEFETVFCDNVGEYFYKLINIMDFINESIIPFHAAGPSKIKNAINLTYQQVTLLCVYLWNKELIPELGRYVAKVILYDYLLDQSRRGYAKTAFWANESYDSFVWSDILHAVKKNEDIIDASINHEYFEISAHNEESDQNKTTTIDDDVLNDQLYKLLCVINDNIDVYCNGENGKERTLVQNNILTTILNIYTYSALPLNIISSPRTELDYDCIIPSKSTHDVDVVINRLGNIALINNKLIDKSRRVSLHRCRTYKVIGNTDRTTLAKYFEYPTEKDINRIMSASAVNTDVYNEFCASREEKIINDVAKYLELMPSK